MILDYCDLLNTVPTLSESEKEKLKIKWAELNELVKSHGRVAVISTEQEVNWKREFVNNVGISFINATGQKELGLQMCKNGIALADMHIIDGKCVRFTYCDLVKKEAEQ